MQPHGAPETRGKSKFFRFFERIGRARRQKPAIRRDPVLELQAVEVVTETTPARLKAANDDTKPDRPQDDPLENWPASYHATQFLDWLQESFFDPHQIEALGIVVQDDSELGVHRWWECPKSQALFAEILCDDIVAAYAEFCADQLLVQHKWNTFAKHFNALLQGESGQPLKPYTQVVCQETGKTHRLRCYRIPVPATFRRREELVRAAA